MKTVQISINNFKQSKFLMDSGGSITINNKSVMSHTLFFSLFPITFKKIFGLKENFNYSL